MSTHWFPLVLLNCFLRTNCYKINTHISILYINWYNLRVEIMHNIKNKKAIITTRLKIINYLNVFKPELIVAGYIWWTAGKQADCKSLSHQEFLTSSLMADGSMITMTIEMTNKTVTSSIHIPISTSERWGELLGGIQGDADLNMINGEPGLQIPSSSNSQSASDRPQLKVASAITARTCRLFLPRAQEGETFGCSLSPDHNIKGQRQSVQLDQSLTWQHLSQ